MPDPEKGPYDCQHCGACCTFGLCVSYESSDSEINRRRSKSADHCVQLTGLFSSPLKPGVRVLCMAYENRPLECLAFENGSEACKNARKAVGL